MAFLESRTVDARLDFHLNLAGDQLGGSVGETCCQLGRSVILSAEFLVCAYVEAGDLGGFGVAGLVGRCVFGRLFERCHVHAGSKRHEAIRAQSRSP